MKEAQARTSPVRDSRIAETQERCNRRIAKTFARVEHVFAGLAQMGQKTLRSIGLARATLHLNWKAVAYNLRRPCFLTEARKNVFWRREIERGEAHFSRDFAAIARFLATSNNKRQLFKIPR